MPAAEPEAHSGGAPSGAPWSCMPGLPSQGPLKPALWVVPSGQLALLPAFSSPVCRGAPEGHTPASAHQLHDPSACQACLPVARSCLHFPLCMFRMSVPSLPLGGKGGPGGHRAAPWTEKLRTASDLREPKAGGCGQTQPPSPLRSHSLAWKAKVCSAPSSCYCHHHAHPARGPRPWPYPTLGPCPGPPEGQPLLVGSSAVP